MHFQNQLALGLAAFLPAFLCHGRPLMDERSHNNTLRNRQTNTVFYAGSIRWPASYDPLFCNDWFVCYYLNPDNAVLSATLDGGTAWQANFPYGDCYDEPNHCELVFDANGDLYVGYDDGETYNLIWESATSGQYDYTVATEADFSGSRWTPWITMKDYYGKVIYVTNNPPPIGAPDPNPGPTPPSCSGNCPPPKEKRGSDPDPQ